MEATWLVSDQSIGSFAEPGLYTPIKRGEVALWVRYGEWEDPDRSWFLVDPNDVAQRLYFLSGQVIDESTQSPISGAEVRILDGYSMGKRAITNENGNYNINKILVGETFSARASKSGYQSLTQSYRVDSPIGPLGNAPFLNFLLRKSE